MKVGVLGTKAKIKYENVIHEVLSYIQSLGYQSVEFERPQDVCGVDVVIVLGGDGAILHAALASAQNGVKIVGVNYGSLGFLTEFEKNETNELITLLKRLENGESRVLKRSILQVEVGGKVFYGLNEAVLHRDHGGCVGKQSQLLRLEIYSNEGKDVVSGDGVLLCTPTGSTAYSLSAGGAILTPEVPVFMMTPVCAFSMRTRPTVFSDNEQFAIKVVKGAAVLSIDGVSVAVLPENATVFVKKAPFTADFPLREHSDFFAKVRNKLSE